MMMSLKQSYLQLILEATMVIGTDYTKIKTEHGDGLNKQPQNNSNNQL